MKFNFNRQVKKLRDVISRFDPESNRLRLSLINEIAQNKILYTAILTTYYESLLFIMAFPPDKKTLDLAEREVRRITALLKKQPQKVKELFINSGIPFSGYGGSFLHDFLRWLLSNPDATVSINSIDNTLFDLNEVLKVTLPSQQRSITTIGYTNENLLNELVPDKNQRLPYIINELSRLDSTPFIKDHYVRGLALFVDITPKNKWLSKAHNRIEIPEYFFHSEMIKHFDVRDLLNRKIPDAAVLSEPEKQKLIRVIRNAMVMTERETDPITYMKEDSLRLYYLERGVSVALYGMTPDRQLPMESYIGYTLFKNGYPAAYAGGWVFGWRSDYGLNIFDQFRGGESAYMVTQVLRVYRQLFHVNYFLVEPSQFGLDGKEGIETGVFWFYYKLGFRPVDLRLRQLAKNEYEKIKSTKGYRSSRETLIKFTDSNIFLMLGKRVQPGVYDITNKVNNMIIKKFRSNSRQAEQVCVDNFLTITRSRETFSKDEFEVLKEVSLWASATNISDNRLNLLHQMVKTKPVDEYRYQEQLRLFFSDYE